jgi:hypothetical protein
MRKTPKSPGDKIVKDIKRATRKHYSSEEKIRIVQDGLRGKDSIADLGRVIFSPGCCNHLGFLATNRRNASCHWLLNVCTWVRKELKNRPQD